MKSLVLQQMTRLLYCVILVAFASHAVMTPALADDDEIRIVAGLGSADTIIGDLEFMIAELAQRKQSFEDNVFPNIDIFLIGIDPELPIRFDSLFRAEHGMELQARIPFTDINDFLQDNLDPIGIIPKRDRRDPNLYELTGTVYTGWLRALQDPNYAVFAKRKEDIPKGMKHPALQHAELVKRGYSMFAHLDNTRSDLKTRQAAFEKMRKAAIEKIQKRPDETQTAFNLRKALTDHAYMVLQQWFVESSGFTAGGQLDKDKAAVVSEFSFGAIAETELAQQVQRVREEASYFAAIEDRDDALMQLRVNFKFDESQGQSLRDVYKLSAVVTAEQIAKDDEATEEQKAARTRAADLLHEVLAASSEFGTIDSAIDILPSGDANVFVMGVRASGQQQILEIIKQLPGTAVGWSLEQDVAEAEGVKIHRLDVGENSSESLAELFGPQHHLVYLAASEQAFWLAFGTDSESVLKERIAKVRTSDAPESDLTVFRLTAQMAPLARSANALLNDESSVFGVFLSARKAELQARRDSQKEGEREESRPAREAASSFLTFEWIDEVLDQMDGEDDTLQLSLLADEPDRLTGSGVANRGILKVIGILIANFADENLQ